MPKKRKYVAATCHAKQCGNYDAAYLNHCRALSGHVPICWQDCFAFMTVDQAARLARAFDLEKDRRKNHAK